MIGKRNELGMLLAIIPAISLLAGCGGNTFTVKTKNGSTVQATTNGFGTYPQDFPLPQYPGSKVTIVTSTNDSGNGKPKKGVILSSSDPATKVAGFYKEQLQTAGWTTDNSAEANNMMTITASRGEAHIYLMIIPTENETSIQINMM